MLKILVKLVDMCTKWFTIINSKRQKPSNISTTTHTTTVLHPFSGTIQVSQCQKRTSALYGARED